MSSRYSYLFAAVAFVGMGVWAGGSLTAQAGDRIEFSRATESLALPAPEQTDNSAVQIFHFGGIGPAAGVPDGAYAIPSPAAPAPRANSRNSHHDGSGWLSGDNQPAQDGLWTTRDPNTDLYGSSSNRVDDNKDWTSPDDATSGLRTPNNALHALSKPDDLHQDSLSPLAKHDAPVGLAYDKIGSRDWAYRSDDAYVLDGKVPGAEQLRAQAKGTTTERFGFESSYSGTMSTTASSRRSFSPTPSATSSSSITASSLSAFSRNDGGDFSANRLSAIHGSSLSSSRTSGGEDNYLPASTALHMWEGLPSFGPVAPPPAPRKSISTQQVDHNGPVPQSGAILAWPKAPGALLGGQP